MGKSFSLPLAITLLASLSSCTGIHYKTFRNGFSGVEGDINPKTRIFLVGGGYPNATFAREVANQKEYWLSQGYSKEQIACYYVPPPTDLIDEKGEVLKDTQQAEVLKQFEHLKHSVEDCFMASTKSLIRHIESLQKENPSSIYIYITGHGLPPLKHLSYVSISSKKSDKESDVNDWIKDMNDRIKVEKFKRKWKKILSLEQWANTYSLQMAAVRKKAFDTYYFMDPSAMAYEFAEDNPNAVNDYLLTPGGLSNALNKLPHSTKKYLVLMGCYSGGFILPPQQAPQGHTLQNVQNISVLTASSSIKVSFINPNDLKTFYGESYFKNLKNLNKNKTFDSIDWKELLKETKESVLQKEKSLKIDPKFFSDPQFFSNMKN